MVKSEGLELKEGMVKSLDPELKESYTFLGIEEGDGQMDQLVTKRVTTQCFRIVKKLCETQLYERNFIKAINTKALGLVRYSMSICHYTISELKELDVRMRRLLYEKAVRGNEESVERLYMKKKEGGRGLISFEQMYKTIKVQIATYLALSEDALLKKVFQRERKKNSWKNPVREAETAAEEVGHELKVEQGKITIDGTELKGVPGGIRKIVGMLYKKWWQEMLRKEYEAKAVKSVIWKEFDQREEGFTWMKKNLTPQQVARVLRVQEQMVPNRWLARMRGKAVENTKCRLCNKQEEGIKHWLCSCEYLAGREYLKRHDQTLRVFYGEVLKQYELVDEQIAWFNIRVEAVRENEKCLVVWNKRIPTHTKVEHRWPDLRIEDKEKKTIWIVDMACPSDGAVKSKEEQKRLNYQELAYDLRTQRQGWRIEIVPLVVGVTGALHNIKQEVAKVILDERKIARCVTTMQKTTVIGSLQMIHRIETQLV
jgi:hypothetical protein